MHEKESSHEAESGDDSQTIFLDQISIADQQTGSSNSSCGGGTRATSVTATRSEEKEEVNTEGPMTIPLHSLTVAQSVDLMKKLFPAVDLKGLVEEEGINGFILNEISSVSDLQELRLDSKLKNIHMRALLGALDRFRKDGVTF